MLPGWQDPQDTVAIDESVAAVDSEDPFGYEKECTRYRAEEHAGHIKGTLKKRYGKSIKKN